MQTVPLPAVLGASLVAFTLGYYARGWNATEVEKPQPVDPEKEEDEESSEEEEEEEDYSDDSDYDGEEHKMVFTKSLDSNHKRF